MERCCLVTEVVKMSRSYKKTPICRDCTGCECLQWSKRQANKKVRRTKNIPSGKSYKKIYETWDIHDYSFRETLSQYKKNLENELKHCLTLYKSFNKLPDRIKKYYFDPFFKYWKKYYYWK